MMGTRAKQARSFIDQYVIDHGVKKNSVILWMIEMVGKKQPQVYVENRQKEI